MKHTLLLAMISMLVQASFVPCDRKTDPIFLSFEQPTGRREAIDDYIARGYQIQPCHILEAITSGYSRALDHMLLKGGDVETIIPGSNMTFVEYFMKDFGPSTQMSPSLINIARVMFHHGTKMTEEHFKSTMSVPLKEAIELALEYYPLDKAFPADVDMIHAVTRYMARIWSADRYEERTLILVLQHMLERNQPLVMSFDAAEELIKVKYEGKAVPLLKRLLIDGILDATIIKDGKSLLDVARLHNKPELELLLVCYGAK